MPRPYKNIRPLIKSQLIPVSINSSIQQYKESISVKQIRNGQIKDYKLFDIPETEFVKK